MIVVVDGVRVDLPEHRAKELIVEGRATPDKVTIVPDDVIQVSKPK